MATQPLGFQSQNGRITIFQDNAENENPMRGKQNVARINAPKRGPLEVISNNSRVQPFRAAKQPLCTNQNTENILGGKTFSQQIPSQPFSIHVDSSSTSSSSCSSSLSTQMPSLATRGLTQSQLYPNITNLRQPLQNITNNVDLEELEETPMVLDTSLDVREKTEPTHEELMDSMLSVSDYASEIYKFIREQEVRHRPKPGYMKKQPDVTSSMRSILVDWLVEVSEEYKLHRETMCLAVNYIDRFLSQMSVLRGKLQLVGAASMFLAAKYEEIYPPEVGEFVYITDDTYTKQQVLRMEHLILKVLSFDVAVPTVNCFCEKFLKDTNADEKTKSLAMYLMELTLIDGDTFLKHLPSEIAASCVSLARHTLNQEAWCERLSQCTEYTLQQLEPCIQDLYAAYIKAPQHQQQAVREKYRSKKFHQVSQLSPPPVLPEALSQ